MVYDAENGDHEYATIENVLGKGNEVPSDSKYDASQTI